MRTRLADAAAEAGVPFETVERVARDYETWFVFERQGCSLNEARTDLALIAEATAALRRAATNLSPVVVALGGVEEDWSPAAARATEAVGALDGLADQAGRDLEARAACYAAGGRSNLAHLIAEPAKVRMVRAVAELLPPDAVSSTVGGPLYKLAAAIHDALTGERDRGIAHAIRSAGIARTCPRKRRFTR